jgi:hypothetical protein
MILRPSPADKSYTGIPSRPRPGSRRQQSREHAQQAYYSDNTAWCPAPDGRFSACCLYKLPDLIGSSFSIFVLTVLYQDLVSSIFASIFSLSTSRMADRPLAISSLSSSA